MKYELNIIGCGRVGRTIAKLFQEAGVVRVKGVLTRSTQSARMAVDFIGAGRPLSGLREFRPSPVWMIATPDITIREVAQALASASLIRKGDVVFHLSGALSSAELADCQSAGASVASIHPIQNFSDPATSVLQFSGTWCAVEGDDEATRVLRQGLDAIGARSVAIAPHQKTLYHAAAVMACNYLVALIDVSLGIFQKAGINRDQAATMLTPILRATLENVLERGTEAAMTGPISRGDVEIVQRHLSQLGPVSPRSASLYKILGQATLDVVGRRGDLPANVAREIREILSE